VDSVQNIKFSHIHQKRNTQPILNLFFYLKRRNLSLDNRKWITTIYVNVWKLFTYTGLEIVINFSKCLFDGYAKILYFERNTRPILNLFFYLQRRNLSLDNRKWITTIYVNVGWVFRSKYKIFAYPSNRHLGKIYNYFKSRIYK
jgi:hypothetical protein